MILDCVMIVGAAGFHFSQNNQRKTVERRDNKETSVEFYFCLSLQNVQEFLLESHGPTKSYR